MKYIEELIVGDSFSYQSHMFLLTSDFKSNGDRLCYSLSNGLPHWFSDQTIVENAPIYTLDKDNNIIPIKITLKHDTFSN